MDLYYYFVFFISEVLIALVFILAVFFLFKKETNLIQTILSGLLSGTSAEFIKYLFPTLRPENPFLGYREGGSFPSGHSALSFGIAFSVFLVNKKKGIVLLIMAILVALGRVLGGAHYIVDVLAGAFVGLIWALILSKFTYDINYKK